MGVIKQSLLNNFGGGWIKAEIVLGGRDLEGVNSSCLPPSYRNFNHAHTGRNTGKGLSIRGFVGLMLVSNATQGIWASPSRHDQCMDSKIYSEGFIENISIIKYLFGHNQCQIQFYKPFSSLQLNWDMKCILIS